MEGIENVNVDDLLLLLDRIKVKAKISIQSASCNDHVKELKVLFLSKKSKLSQILRQLNKIPAKKRSIIGKSANELRNIIEGLILQKNKFFNKKEELKYLKSSCDVTLPGRCLPDGGKHPLTLVSDSILNVLKIQGFSLIHGPEIEHDYYNFEALNISKDHPARDMQDTFYIDSDVVLRTHTSPVQIRAMLTMKNPPIKITSIGRVYRRDQDVTHSPMFHQIECLCVGKKINFSNLKNALQNFLDGIFNSNLPIRLRSSYFPFTEPSVEVDIICFNCRNNTSIVSCKLCKGTGWIEIMGAGMVHPKVLEAGGINQKNILVLRLVLALKELL